MEVVAVSQQKGGVCKTTTALNLGAELAAMGHVVVLIDPDTSADLSTRLNVFADSEDDSLYGVLIKGTPIVDALKPTAYNGLFVLPGHRMNSSAESELGSRVPGARLRKALSGLDVFVEATGKNVDFVICDGKPGMETLALECLALSSCVIAPTEIGSASIEQIGGIFELVEEIRTELGRSINTHILRCLTKENPGAIVRSIEERDLMAGPYGPYVLETKIPESVRVREAAKLRVPIRALMESKGKLDSTDRRIATKYEELAQEFLAKEVRA